MRLMSNPLPNPQTAQNTNDLNHGSLAILLMGHGRARALAGSTWKGEICNYSCGLFHKMDRGQTASQNDKKGGQEVRMGQHRLSVRTAKDNRNGQWDQLYS
ncbi:hypothetical protein Tco_0374381 [Tanacetum coccineum]